MRLCSASIIDPLKTSRILTLTCQPRIGDKRESEELCQLCRLLLEMSRGLHFMRRVSRLRPWTSSPCPRLRPSIRPDFPPNRANLLTAGYFPSHWPDTDKIKVLHFPYPVYSHLDLQISRRTRSPATSCESRPMKRENLAGYGSRASVCA